MAKKFRIAILLFVLLTVAVGSWQARVRTTSWKRALDVVVFPINADGTAQTAEYIRGLTDEAFEPIRVFMRPSYLAAIRSCINLLLATVSAFYLVLCHR